ncbi:MAG: alanine--tRNA ligase [Candidatus Aenigmatarchaeota archaeon]
MITKDDLRRPEHFALEWFKKNGFERYTCEKCKAAFWSTVPRDTCGEPPCEMYDFLGNPIIPGKWDMDSMRSAFINFFEANEHKPITRYPIVCRWKPDTLFTGASIYCFMPWVLNRTIEPPANPLVMSQPSFRAQDLDNIGLGTARHCSIFEMMAHHAFNYPEKDVYWKDKTVDLCWRWLTERLKINSALITFKENSWEGGGYAGPCFEVLAAGNELATLVFMEFAGPFDGKYEQLDVKVVDTGYGLERHVWAATGTPTVYDAAYPKIIRWLANKAGVAEPDPELFYMFCQSAGSLNVEETNVEEMRKKIVARIAEELGFSIDEIMKVILSYSAIYQIADHTKAIAFILNDGVVPSNVAEGYIARLLIRRAIRNLNDLGLREMPLSHVVAKQIDGMKNIFSEMYEHRNSILKMVDVESEKYASTLKRGAELVRKIVADMKRAGKKEIDRETLAQLYDSHGLLPRDVKNWSELPLADISDIDTKIAVQKSIVKIPAEKALIDVSGLPDTKALYHEDEKLYEFKAKVLRIIDGKWVVLDQTAFYPRGGGQEPDHGSIEGYAVYDVEKIGNVIVHAVEEPEFKEGDIVKCNINIPRRKQIAMHHTATHIINGAARRLLGDHIWQAGSKKDVDKAHLDVTHYAPLTEHEVAKIEQTANDIVKKKLRVIKQVLPRDVAEKKFGYRLYQGGAVPGRELHTIDISGWDVEACGGIHVDNTAEVGPIIILKTERVQDGIVRLIYASGPAAQKHLAERAKILSKCARALKVSEMKLPAACRKLLAEWKKVRKQLNTATEKAAQKKIKALKFVESDDLKILVAEIPGAGAEQLKEISLKLSADNTVIVLFGTRETVSVFASAGKDAVNAGIDVGKIVQEACRELGGRGGGQPGLAQGIGKYKSKVKRVVDKLRTKFSG